MDELFIGSALCEVTTKGDFLLPRYFLETLQQRSSDQLMFVGLHETSPCLIAYDRPYALQRQYEANEDDPQRLRRTYGFVDRAVIAPGGMMTIPALMRERGRIGGSVLLVATGQRFEIWDLERVLQAGPSDLILLATHHRMINIAKEVLHVPALPSPRPPHRNDDAAQSGFRVQPVLTVRPRHDPIGLGGSARSLAAGSHGLPGDPA